ncbi:P-loop NTPase [Litoricolaceae bacterium]|nr:P-loop NTPase [Litorivicinaceae bacterium]
MKSIGIASGKGGVGKTTVATNLACALAKANHRVMLVDGDLGLANVQLALGIHAKFNLGHYIRGEKPLSEVVITTPSGLKVVAGTSGDGALADLNPQKLSAVMTDLIGSCGPLDFLIFDAAAGVSSNVIPLLKLCDQALIVVRDDPSSIADCYGIIKILKNEHDYEATLLLANGVESENEGANLHARVNSACNKFLSTNVQYLGHVVEDSTVKESAKKYKPIVEAFPSAKASVNFRALAKTIASI